jgi:tight adherence protein C
MSRYRRQIESDLPFWLDLHTTLMEGGMGFDEALARMLAEIGFLERPIFRELNVAYKRQRLGATRPEALLTMAAALDVEPLDVVVNTIVQGERMGASVSDTLRAQADMIRNKVWEEAQARAQRLPTKLIFPIAVGVLPSFFLITVGPPLLKLLQFFEKR